MDAPSPRIDAIFAGPGEMRARCRAHDWAATALGPVEDWPNALRTIAHAVLGSAFAKIVLWGPDLIQIYNDAYAPILGVKHPWGLGRPTKEVWPEAWAFNSPIYARVSDGDTVALQDQRYRLAQRGPESPLEDVYLTISYSPVLDDRDRIGGVLVTMIDTTEAVHGRDAAAALAESEARLRLREDHLERVFAQAPVAVCVVRGHDLLVELANAFYRRIVPRVVVGRPLGEALPEIEEQGYAALLRGVISTGEPWIGTGVELEYDRNGTGSLELAYFNALYFPLVEPDGARIGVIAVVVEVTEEVLARREVERLLGDSERAAVALRAGEQRMRDVFEQSPIAVAVLEGPEHVYTIASPRYRESPGGGRPLIGRSIREAFPEIVAQGYVATMDRVFETGEPHVERERRVMLDHDGDGVAEEYFFNVGYQPLRDVDGKVYAISSVAYDVTTHVVARREVEVARAEAETARAEAEAANRAKSEFLATMSHELRTPLNAIGGYTDLIALGVHGPVTDAQQEALARVQRSNQHLLSLINDVLSFAKLEAGRIEYAAERLRLADVVSEVLPMIEPQLAAKGLTATVHVDPRLEAVADADAVRQIVLNLLSNAVKFTPQGGITLDASQREGAPGEVFLRVTDSGIGIPEEKQHAIFDPFVQVRRGLTRQVEGTGLGLAISRDLARGMGGDLRVRSVEGEGSTFTLSLPMASDGAGDAGNPHGTGG